MRHALLIFSLFALSACGDTAPDPQAVARAAAIPDAALFGATPCEQLQGVAAAGTKTDSRPGLSASLQAVYTRSCQICHENPAAGAPLRGDEAAWAPRVAQGMDQLLHHTIHGFQKMPPLGLCMSCSEEELAQLIRYMAGNVPTERN